MSQVEKTRFFGKIWFISLVLLGLLCVAFYWDVLRLPADHIIAGNDLTNMFLHWSRFAVDSVRHGRFPLWNPYLFAGLPFAANPQPALFYPPTWLALLMPVTRALGVIIVLHIWLAGAGMYLWLRSERASVSGALLGAATFAFSGYFFVRVYAGHLGVITTCAWLPLILWLYHCADSAGKRQGAKSWKLAVVGGLPVGLSILAGHTASFIYVALGLSAYALFYARLSWRSGRPAWPHLLRLTLMLATGTALAAVQILPLTELMARSIRQATANYDFATRFSWPPGYLLTLLVPNFFGEPARTGYWGDGIYDEFIIYVGVLPLILALLGSKLRHRLKIFLIGLGLGSLLLAFGKYGSLHLLFYRFVPFFKTLRAPARAGFLFTLAAAALFGLTVTAIQESQRERARLLRPLRWSRVLAFSGGVLALIVTGFVAFAWGRESHGAAGRLWHLANQTSLFLLFFLLAAGLLTAWREVETARSTSSERVRPEMWLLALILVILDLWTFGSGTVSPVEVQESAYWRIVEQAVSARSEVEAPASEEFTRVLPWGLNDVEQNGGMAFGIQSVFGYDPLTLQRYEDFITSSSPDPRARTYDLLNAGYLVTTSPQDFPAENTALEAPQLIHEQAGVYVYKRPDALPRAWVAPQIEVLDEAAILSRIHEPEFDPRTTALVETYPEQAPGAGQAQGTAPTTGVKILGDTGNRFEAEVDGAGGMLIVSAADYPGWRAWVDGERAQVVRADYVLRAVYVPAGTHHVTMAYNPPLLKIGLAITALTLACIIGLWSTLTPRGKR
jgi:hypothetical protein